MKHEKIPKDQEDKKNDESRNVSLNERVDSIDKNSKESKEVEESEYPVEHCSQEKFETPETK